MDRVISLLFDIENKANQIIEKANLEKNELYEENENQIHKMEASIAEENTEKINLVLEQAQRNLEQEIQQLLDNSNKQLDDLEANFKNNHDRIVDRILKGILTF